jgi:myo-inositol-1(or 4)-monophosphatase
MKVSEVAVHARQVQLEVAVSAVRSAAAAIKGQFGDRDISTYKGRHDVQLNADLTAQKLIVDLLQSEYPDHGIVAEEDEFCRWSDSRFLWAIDPLDGTNNFGYGIAHCALAVTLFEEESVALAVVHDPLIGRSFSNVAGAGRSPRPARPVPSAATSLSRATLSLVTGYAEHSRAWGNRFADWMSVRCKRVVNLWAPALDLALVSSGALDAMVCHGADLLDVCSGMFLVESAGGCVVTFDGTPLRVRRSLHKRPVSFIAGRSPGLVEELVAEVGAMEGELRAARPARVPEVGSPLMTHR